MNDVVSRQKSYIFKFALHGRHINLETTSLQFADWNMVSSVGAFLFGVSQILFLFIVLKTVMGGKKATDQVWEGARGLEWTVASPAPYHTFTTPPKVD